MVILCTFACGDSHEQNGQSLGTFGERSRISSVDPNFVIPDYTLKRVKDFRAPIPIFIITCDRLTWLKRTLVGLNEAIDHPIEVVIHDNNTQFPEMVAFLDELEQTGIRVYRHNQSLNKDTQLNNVGQTIAAWYNKNDAPYYAVTDPDIEFTRYDGRLLEFYMHLLDRYPDVNVVGPMLRIDDLPDYYPFKSDILANETARMQRVPTFYESFHGENQPITYGAIDTTFGLYRKSFKFRRINTAIQAYGAYAARHLDWYLDPNNLTADQAWYLHHASTVSHSGGTWLREFLAGQQSEL